MIKIILRQDYKSLGKVGEIISVKDGFARNFLIPQKIGIRATPANMKIFEEEQKQIQKRLNKDKLASEKLAKEFESLSLTATVAVGEEDKVFGSVTAQTVSDLLKAKGFDIDKRKILLDEPIKALGVYNIPVKLHSEVEANVRVWVVKE
jgi:large subunit ribosomal protein L9